MKTIAEKITNELKIEEGIELRQVGVEKGVTLMWNKIDRPGKIILQWIKTFQGGFTNVCGEREILPFSSYSFSDKELINFYTDLVVEDYKNKSFDVNNN